MIGTLTVCKWFEREPSSIVLLSPIVTLGKFNINFMDDHHYNFHIGNVKKIIRALKLLNKKNEFKKILQQKFIYIVFNYNIFYVIHQ